MGVLYNPRGPGVWKRCSPRSTSRVNSGNDVPRDVEGQARIARLEFREVTHVTLLTGYKGVGTQASLANVGISHARCSSSAQRPKWALIILERGIV